jgi:hypothetical protein
MKRSWCRDLAPAATADLARDQWDLAHRISRTNRRRRKSSAMRTRCRWSIRTDNTSSPSSRSINKNGLHMKPMTISTTGCCNGIQRTNIETATYGLQTPKNAYLHWYHGWCGCHPRETASSQARIKVKVACCVWDGHGTTSILDTGR